MKLFDQLSDVDKNLIEKYIDTYALDGTSRSVDLAYLLRFWDKEKQDLYRILGNDFIISKEVTFEKGQEEMLKQCDLLLSNDGYVFYRQFLDWTENYYFVPDSVDKWRSSDERYYYLSNLISTSTLSSNVYDNFTFELETPNGKSLKIQSGCKAVKALGKIADAFGLEGYEQFRIAHSMIFNQKKLKGNLCLSIHPLDYMTMSDNDSDWSSCMNWMDAGCYRQGTVEMMNSNMVVVAYLTASDDMRIPGGWWNNKKWRELYVVNRDIITNIKAYPYRNDAITTEVLKWLKELVEKDNFSEYTDKYYPYSVQNVIHINELNKTISFDTFTYRMYNDFHNSDGQLGYFSKFIEENKDYDFNYSGASECLACGLEDPDIDDESFLVGDCCDDSYYCDICGTRYPSSEMHQVDGEFICNSCYDYETMVDPIDEDVHLINNMISLHLCLDKDDDTFFELGMRFCDWHYYKSYMEDFFTHLYKRTTVSSWGRTIYVVYAEDVTSNGDEIFYEQFGARISDGKEEFKSKVLKYCYTDSKETFSHEEIIY